MTELHLVPDPGTRDITMYYEGLEQKMSPEEAVEFAMRLLQAAQIAVTDDLG